MKSDWDISGTGDFGIVEDADSKRLQLSGQKLCLYNGRNNLLNAEIIVDVKLGSRYAPYTKGGVVHRCDASSDNCYYFCVAGSGGTNRMYYIYRIISGIATQLAFALSTQPYYQYVKTRFRIDEKQLSIEEYIEGNWKLILLLEDGFITAAGYSGFKATHTDTSYYILFDNVEIGEKI